MSPMLAADERYVCRRIAAVSLGTNWIQPWKGCYCQHNDRCRDNVTRGRVYMTAYIHPRSLYVGVFGVIHVWWISIESDCYVFLFVFDVAFDLGLYSLRTNKLFLSVVFHTGSYPAEWLAELIIFTFWRDKNEIPCTCNFETCKFPRDSVSIFCIYPLVHSSSRGRPEVVCTNVHGHAYYVAMLKRVENSSIQAGRRKKMESRIGVPEPEWNFSASKTSASREFHFDCITVVCSLVVE